MTSEKDTKPEEVVLYLKRASEALQVAAYNLDSGHFATAVNRSYYAIFYATNAMLATRKLARSKHSGVIGAFREQFVRAGLIEPEYSRIYGRVMDDRHLGDYEIRDVVTSDQAQSDLEDAQRFVSRIKVYLEEQGWL